MQGRVLDSNKLISQLHQLRANSTRNDAEKLACQLIEAYDTDSILTPVEVEVLAGVRDSHDRELTEHFLRQFRVIDKRRITPKDWEEAVRIAKQVVEYDREVPRRQRRRPRQHRPNTPARDLGDCLIKAIANRLHLEVITEDEGLARQAGRAGPSER